MNKQFHKLNLNTIMNKPIYISILLALFALNIISAQSSIKGEGDVVKQEINLDDFDGIQLALNADIILLQGKSQKVVIEAQQNIIDNIKKEVNGDSWNIEYDVKVKGSKDVTIYITIPEIENIAMSGSGSITSKGKFTGLDDVDIAMSGSGSINLGLEAEDVDFAMSGSGDVTLSGSGESFNIAISGSGEIQASDFSVTACAIAISGSGDVTVDVNGSLEVAISGSGNVKYTGDAKVESRIVGSGDIVKL
jgi:hypothetical protein